MASMKVITVNIGRNVNDVPMNATRWETFQGDVAHLLRAAGGTQAYIQAFTGTGEWYGVPEDSVSFTCTFAGRCAVSTHAFRKQLADLAKAFDQTSIFVSFGAGRMEG